MTHVNHVNETSNQKEGIIMTKQELKRLKRENQELRTLVNRLEKNKERIAVRICTEYDYYSFLNGFDYVLDDIIEILRKR